MSNRRLSNRPMKYVKDGVRKIIVSSSYLNSTHEILHLRLVKRK